MRKLRFEEGELRNLLESIGRPIVNARSFFALLAREIDTDVQMQFRNEGAAGGPRKIPGDLAWRPFKETTLRNPKTGTWKIRYGTDMSGKGMRGKYRPEARRYSANSKLLQASGQFRQSFTVLSVTNDRMEYGTRHRLSGKIGSNPERQVLFVTDADKDRWARSFSSYIAKGILR